MFYETKYIITLHQNLSRFWGLINDKYNFQAPDGDYFISYKWIN